MPISAQAQRDLARRLLDAERTRKPIAPLTDELTDLTLNDAYAIQDELVAAKLAAGDEPVGWKAGFTSRAMQQQMGVVQPNRGRLLRSGVDGLDLALLGVALERNGEVELTGAGAAALGHPGTSVASITNQLALSGLRLEPGDIVISGGLTAAPFVAPGDGVTARFHRLGVVEFRAV